jgi:hypothetical protein
LGVKRLQNLERSFINLRVARYIHHSTYDDAGQ